jgi:hypothetical protein
MVDRMQAINGPRDDVSAPDQRDAPTQGDPLPQEVARQLASAALAVVKQLGVDSVELDAHDRLRLTRLARVATALGMVTLIERAADPAEREADGALRRFTAYLADADDDAAVDGDDSGESRDPFALRPKRAMFALVERHSAQAGPADWHLQLLMPPELWYNATVAALFATLEPLLPPLH